jgi:hypothetical protein
MTGVVMLKKLDNFGTLTLSVYKNAMEQWVFDDSDVGLVQEAFVAGANEIMDKLTEHYVDTADSRFTLHMREAIPEDVTNAIECIHSEHVSHDILGGSDYYNCSALNRRIWLCPNLYRYISSTPQILWFWGEPIE